MPPVLFPLAGNPVLQRDGVSFTAPRRKVVLQFTQGHGSVWLQEPGQ